MARINMHDAERDKEILEVIAREHSFQWEYLERLDSKLSNCVFLASAIATLYFGLDSFSLEKISFTNQYYSFVIFALLFGVGLFILAIAFSFWGYRPIMYKNYPANPTRFINEYKTQERASIIEGEGATIAGVIFPPDEVSMKPYVIRYYCTRKKNGADGGKAEEDLKDLMSSHLAEIVCLCR